MVDFYGQVVSDLTATLALLLTALTIYCFTVLVPLVRAKLLWSSRCQGNKAETTVWFDLFNVYLAFNKGWVCVLWETESVVALCHHEQDT